MGPRWPATLSAYNSLGDLARPDWAWEFLRRSPNYCLQAKLHGCLKTLIVPGTENIRVSRVRRRSLQAEVWGLSSFRSPGSTRSYCPDCLVTGEFTSCHRCDVRAERIAHR
ncbi:MAG: transcriptional regulator domain-containing protein [Hyphomicrobiaceae bacterium]